MDDPGVTARLVTGHGALLVQDDDLGAWSRRQYRTRRGQSNDARTHYDEIGSFTHVPSSTVPIARQSSTPQAVIWRDPAGVVDPAVSTVAMMAAT